ncbi:fungal-specific transcription factor domain-containing protein [Xylaria digitata]|nr:fungal-specific transcription factor domain-containing protein [Xylaria digitata]
MQTRRGRPEPVSCQLCRLKKLRCNRAQPCSNCESRNVPCHFLIPPSRSQRVLAPEVHKDAEILARIERLESIVLPEDTTGEKSLDERIASASRSEEASQYRDLHLLDNVGVREDSLISALSNNLAFTIRSVDDILDSLGDSSQYASSTSDGRISKTIITLPPYQTAVLLFSCFEANIDHMCQILNLPAIQSLMKSFYTRISQNESVLPGQAALLLSLFALSAFFYQPTGSTERADIGNDTTRFSKYWSGSALDVLEYSRRNTSGTLEDVQALILMSYVTYHLDGFSARHRHLLALAVSTARDLGLHRLDANDSVPRSHDVSLRVLIDHEVKRRVYWHLIASDWTQSTMSGPQEGTYFIHPNHIQVNLPKDYNDDDDPPGDARAEITGPRPTGLTFLLARIRLAHLSREYTDTIPLETSKLMRVPYERIISLDQKLREFFLELPYFFRLDKESRQKSTHLEAVYTKVPMMRYCILAAAHTRRCRLHQKFLIRMSSDPRYDYSRQACLESARVVIQLYEEPKSEGDSPSMETARMAMAVHYTHIALAIQVMDLCFNKNEADHGERKKEVLTMLQMLEGSRAISPLLNRSLDSVIEVLRKHEVYFPGEALADHDPQGTAQVHEGNPYPIESVQADFPQRDMEIGQSEFTGTPSINEFWQSANEFEMEFDSATWDSLFSTLDSRPF